MTANQINYANYLEKVRSDLATERLRGSELEESKRATNLMRDTNLRQIEANILNTETSAAAARYGANAAAGASMYGAQQSRAASEYGARQSRAASEYSTERQYTMNKQRIAADVELKSSQAYLNVTTANTRKVDTAVNFGQALLGGISKIGKLAFGA